MNDDKIHGAGILAFTHTGKAIMVSRKTNGLFGLPFGKVEEGETTELAAVREFKEETGIDLSAEKYKVDIGNGTIYTKLFELYSGASDERPDCPFIGTTYLFLDALFDERELSNNEGLIYKFVYLDDICNPNITEFPHYNKMVVRKLKEMDELSKNHPALFLSKYKFV